MSSKTLRQIGELNTLSLRQAEERRRKLAGTAPLAQRRRFLIKRPAYRVQEFTHGRLPEDVSRRAADTIREAELDEEDSIPGTQFARVRNGRRYELTAIARHGVGRHGCRQLRRERGRAGDAEAFARTPSICNAADADRPQPSDLAPVPPRRRPPRPDARGRARPRSAPQQDHQRLPVPPSRPRDPSHARHGR